MTLQNFTEVINIHKDFYEKTRALYDAGVDMLESKYELNTPFHKIFNHLIASHYNEEGIDWIEWFIYESDYGEKDWSDRPVYVINEEREVEKTKNESKYGAHDVDGTPICYDIESLYEYIEANHKVKKKCSKKCSENCGCQI